jgi:hypothetical protein
MLPIPILCSAILIAADGRLEPKLSVNGQPAACKLTATSEGRAPFTSESTLELADGIYALRVECPHEGTTLVALQPNLRIKAGTTLAPKIELTPAKLRVEARRNGVLLPADVRVLPPKAIDAAPLAELAANQSRVIAAGRYDVLVILKDKASPEAETLLEGVKVGGPKTTVLSADLSDGGLIADVTNNGRGASASVRAFKPGKQKEVGLVETGQEMRLPPGRYTITTELRDASDFATIDREVWIRAGKVTRVQERFTTGQLTVAVVQDGKPVDANVRLAKPGATDFFNYFPAPGTVSLTPGSYDLTIDSKAAGPLERVVEPNVAVGRGSTTKRTIDLTPATLGIRATKNGAPTEAKIVVRTAGGGDSIEPGADGKWRLWPGNYEIAAELEDGTQQVEGPFPVKLREKLERTVKFERAFLTVRAHRGKTVADDAEVLVYRQGASAPAAKGKPGAKLEVPPGVYDIKVVSGADVVWQKDVKLKKTQFVDVMLPPRADVADDLPEGDLAPPGDDLPEGDPEG